jgi:NADH:ubiquinone oxidoreductase subunit 6 (subunit J)
MLTVHFLDLIPIWLLFIGAMSLMVFFIEVGFRLGKRALLNAKKAQISQVRAIMGAGLGLLAFILAFTFSTAQSHFELRVQSVAEEARIARNAFMQADLLAEPERTQAKQLLKDYIDLRSNMRNSSNLNVSEAIAELISFSEQIQKKLWALAVNASRQNTGDQSTEKSNDAFMASVLALIDIHFTRVHSSVMNRIPLTIWITLYLMAALSMIIMGYQAGLTERRSPVATVTLALAFSAVIILITDLDRPVMRFFQVNRQLLVDLDHYMHEDLQLEYRSGD